MADMACSNGACSRDSLVRQACVRQALGRVAAHLDFRIVVAQCYRLCRRSTFLRCDGSTLARYRQRPSRVSVECASDSRCTFFAPATENLYRAGNPLVQDIVTHWGEWRDGVPRR
ncbi:MULTISPECIES: purine nucleoside permease [unclassified Burkholderia]|uniref:purine nucleoside permease n=1 Tax=unclassified Burkholderia TaxID=2613784 RepID=UPI00141FA059|nr:MULTISPECIES: purine nucleoside permease [unclassified Burkholderia]